MACKNDGKHITHMNLFMVIAFNTKYLNTEVSLLLIPHSLIVKDKKKIFERVECL